MVTVIGHGYSGLPLAMLAVEAGHRVVGIDHDVARVEQLRRGESHADDVEASRLQAALESGRYRATTDYSGASGFEAAAITVPTPLRDRSPDLSFVRSAARELAPHVSLGSPVALESTTAAVRQYVVACSTNEEWRGTAPHVRHRNFSSWVDERYPHWKPTQITGDLVSEARQPEFFIYKRRSM